MVRRNIGSKYCKTGEFFKVVLSFSTTLSCSSTHWKCVSSFTRTCSGAVIVDIFGTWLARKFIIPSSRRTPALSVGIGMLEIASTLVGSDVIPSLLIMVPRYFT